MRSPSHWRHHSGLSGLGRLSGQQPKFTVYLTTSILSLYKCHRNPDARQVSEEATLQVGVPVNATRVRDKQPNWALLGILTHKVKWLTGLCLGGVSSTITDNWNISAQNSCHIPSHCCWSENVFRNLCTLFHAVFTVIKGVWSFHYSHYTNEEVEVRKLPWITQLEFGRDAFSPGLFLNHLLSLYWCQCIGRHSIHWNNVGIMEWFHWNGWNNMPNQWQIPSDLSWSSSITITIPYPNPL